MPVMQTMPRGLAQRSESSKVVAPTSSSTLSTPLDETSRTCSASAPEFDEHLVDPVRTEQPLAIRSSGRRCDEGAMRFGDRGRRQTNRGCPAANQQSLALLQAQRFKQRTPGRLHPFPGWPREHSKASLSSTVWTCRYARIFGVTAVELTPHSAHSRCDHIALLEFIARRLFHQADRLDAQNSGEFDAWRVALPGEEFGAVEAEGLDADQDLALSGPAPGGSRS